MAKKTSIINVVVAGDSKPFRKSLGKASSSLGEFSKKVGAASLVAGAALIGVGTKSINLAVDFEESLSKAQQIFGTSAKAIEDSAKGAATAVGLSKAEFLEASSTFGIFGKASGLAGDDLSSFSIDLVGMAADVASFNNLQPEAAVEKLAAGLRGSMEPLQSVGILMNAAMVNAEALDMGLIDVGDTLTEGQKIMARHSLIMQQLGETGTMGDFARTSDGLANKQRILTARFKNLGIELGVKLLPIAEKLANGLETVIGKFEEWTPTIKDGITAIGDFIVSAKDLGIEGFDYIKGKVEDFKTNIWPQVNAAFQGTVDFIAGSLVPAIVSLSTSITDWISGTAIPALIKFRDDNPTFFKWVDENINTPVGKALDAAGITKIASAGESFTIEHGRFFGDMFKARGVGMEDLSNQSIFPDANIRFEDVKTTPEIGVFGNMTNRQFSTDRHPINAPIININMPSGTDAQDVVSELQRLIRDSGALQVATTELVRN